MNLFRNQYYICKSWYQHDHTGKNCTQTVFSSEATKQILKDYPLYKAVRKAGPFGVFTNQWPYRDTIYRDDTTFFPFLKETL